MAEQPVFFRFSLTVRMALASLVLSALCVGVLHHLSREDARRQAMDDLVRSTDTTAAALARGIERVMLSGREPHREVGGLLDDVVADAGLVSAVLRGKDGRAVVASPRVMTGGVLARDSRECMICHANPSPGDLAPAQRLDMRDRDGQRIMTLVRTISARPGCLAGDCHESDQGRPVLGVLAVEIPVSARVEAALAPADANLAAVLAVMAAGAALFATWIFHRIERPHAMLAAALRRTALGASWSDVDTPRAGAFRDMAVSVNVIARAVRRRQQEVDENLSMYQSLFDGVPCLITVQDRDLRLVRYSKCANCPVEKTFRDGKSHTTEEMGVYKDGTPAYWIVRTAPVRNSSGEITAVMEMSLDITQRKELEEKLKKSERTYSTIFDNIPVAVFEIDAKSLLVRNCNRKMSQLYGYCKGEVIGKSFAMLFAHDAARIQVEDLCNQKRVAQATHVDKDSKEFFVSIDIARASLNGVDILLAVVTDVTDRIRAEQQVIQSSKMATLGEMAAGVAHELNQPLAVLRMVANFFARRSRRGELPDADELGRMTDKIVNNVDRATKIIEHMREFGRKPNLELTPVSVNTVLQRACDFFSEQLKIRDIAIVWELDPDQPPVLADPNRLEQVFINLLVNARDAIEDKCSAKECIQGDRIITLRTRSNARHVVTEVIDTGPGIPRAVVARIFEPFFSTKEVGRGTGLGLSICYDIVTDYDGTIHVFSKPGGGARFVVSLPIADLVRPVSS
jgi:histidine kinase